MGTREWKKWQTNHLTPHGILKHQRRGRNRVGAATVFASNRIEVINIVMKGPRITYAFEAVAPSYKGLYQIKASFSVRPSEPPVADFSVIVTDAL